MHTNLTLPNLLTALRLALAPLVVWRVVQADMHGAFWLFVVAAVTDLLDGNLARLLDQRSVLGTWLDPIADKVLLLSTLISLSWVGFLPWWLALVVLARDGVVVGGAGVYLLLTGHLEVAPTLSGKLAIFVEAVLVSLVLADAALALGLSDLVQPLAGATALMAVVSGLHYVVLWTGKTRRYLQHHQAEG